MKRIYTDREREIICRYWDSILAYMDDDIREYTHNHSEKEGLVEWLDDYLDNAYMFKIGHYELFLNTLDIEFGVDLR